MSTLDVSIIIPCRNAARWLPATVESALLQNEMRREILLVDDGSTDNSLEIARGFEVRGIKVFTQSRRGASAARNHGLAQAQGAWIQFLDADDLLAPGKIARQLAALSTEAPDVVASGAWHRFVESPGPESGPQEELAVFRDFTPAWHFLRQQAQTGCMIQPGAWLTSRALLDQAGPWDENLGVNDDGEYFARVLSRASRIQFVDQAEIHYRTHRQHSLSQLRTYEGMSSLYRSVQKVSAELLRCDSSLETRLALAEMWERVRFELYPVATELSRAAGIHARADGLRPTTRLPCGPRLKWLRTIGAWKLARRLQHRFR